LMRGEIRGQEMPDRGRTRRAWGRTRLAAAAIVLLAASGSSAVAIRHERDLKGYDITPTGLTPQYPTDLACSPLTSLYASWIDVDGSRRTEAHSGVDGGRLGDPILAPAPGTVRAVWRANWGWGREGALLITHTKDELNLTDGADFYFSEFDHLSYSDISHFQVGQKIARGEQLAHVFRPGGQDKYLPEVHWEVWELADNDDVTWATNKFGGRYWINQSARLIDPLYLLAQDTPSGKDGRVAITPFVAGRDYSEFRGFTYILPCR
jgi:murein DD-endopeptidase MepM/ murein hydrolase activator NlpD